MKSPWVLYPACMEYNPHHQKRGHQCGDQNNIGSSAGSGSFCCCPDYSSSPPMSLIHLPDFQMNLLLKTSNETIRKRIIIIISSRLCINQLKDYENIVNRDDSMYTSNCMDCPDHLHIRQREFTAEGK